MYLDFCEKRGEHGPFGLQYTATPESNIYPCNKTLQKEEAKELYNSIVL